ncbi:MAG: DUF6489 family protein [Alphaproteobacteria bacterium]
MKIKVDVDCTPEEARVFLGLPDVQSLQASMMAEMEKKMLSSMALMEPEALLKHWLPMGMQGMEAFQKMVWDAATGAPAKSAAAKPPGGKERA